MKERHILAPEADPDQLHDWLLERGLRLVLDQTRAHLFPRLLRWEGAGVTVIWVENHRLGVRCLEVQGRLEKPPLATISTSRLLETSGHDGDSRRALEYLETTEAEFWNTPKSG